NDPKTLMTSSVESLHDLCARTMNVWDQIRNHLQKTISHQNYENWFRGVAFAGMEGKSLRVVTPDPGTRTVIETEFGSVIAKAIRELGLPVEHVSFEVQPPSGALNQAL